MSKPIKCPRCFKWYPFQQNLDAHLWWEHYTDEERDEVVKNRKKPVPMTDEDWNRLKRGE